MRFLFLCLLVYLGYRLLKGILAPGPSSSGSQKQDDLAPVDDIMVKDPFCQTYIPKRDGIKEVINGQTYFFCSAQCRDKYIQGAGKASD
jgi:YHS domain-containing protein